MSTTKARLCGAELVRTGVMEIREFRTLWNKESCTVILSKGYARFPQTVQRPAIVALVRPLF